MSRNTVVHELHVRPMIKLASGLVDGLRIDQRLKLMRAGKLEKPKKVQPIAPLILKGDPGYKERDKEKAAKRRRARKRRQKAKQQAHTPVKPAIPSAMDLADQQKRANVAMAAKTIRQQTEPIQADECPY